jgi:hypothetical protein
VQARPETPWYRARKFAGRHRAGVVVTVLALLLLPGFALREAHLPFTAAATVHMARAMAEHGNAAAAEPLFRMVIERLGPHPPGARDQYVLAHTGLGRALIAQSRAHEALAVLGEARRHSADFFGEEDRRTAEAELGLGVALMALERYAEAEPLLLRTHRGLEASAIRQPRLLAESRVSIADLYRRMGRLADAASFDPGGVGRNP